MMYPLTLTPDDNGTLLVTCDMLPEVTSFGEEHTEALHYGRAAVEEALAARMAHWEDIPVPTGADLAIAFAENRAVKISLLAEMKLDLYLACRAANVSRADLVRRLGWAREQVDRLFRLEHASKVEQIEAAAGALGKDVYFFLAPGNAAKDDQKMWAEIVKANVRDKKAPALFAHSLEATAALAAPLKLRRGVKGAGLKRPARAGSAPTRKRGPATSRAN